jgi:hypothetical protein
MLTEVGFTVDSLVVKQANAMPGDLKVLADVAGALGGNRDEALAQLEAYQYVFAARPI